MANYFLAGIILVLIAASVPVFAEGDSFEEKITEQQKKEIEKNLKQIEDQRELQKKQFEREHEDDDDDEKGSSILGRNTFGLILDGTISSILGVVGYSGYKVFSIRRASLRKKRQSLEGMPK